MTRAGETFLLAAAITLTTWGAHTLHSSCGGVMLILWGLVILAAITGPPAQRRQRPPERRRRNRAPRRY